MNLEQEELLSYLRKIDEYRFEHFVADIWEQRGWKTTVTQSSNDRGIDIIAEKNSPFPQKQLIQTKKYSKSNKIGSPDIQQYSSLRQQEERVDAIVVVTTSTFTSQAEETAQALNVKLIDGRRLYEIIWDTNIDELLGKYDIGTLPEESDTDYLKIDHAEIIAKRAQGASVTAKRLTLVGTNHGYLSDKPAIEYFRSDEQPHYFFYNEEYGVKRDGERISTDGTGAYRGSMWVTDKGIHFFQGREKGPDSHCFAPYELTLNISGTIGDFIKRIKVRSFQGEFRFPINPETDELEEAAEYMNNVMGNDDPLDIN